jgi:hypothetical protein
MVPSDDDGLTIETCRGYVDKINIQFVESVHNFWFGSNHLTVVVIHLRTHTFRFFFFSGYYYKITATVCTIRINQLLSYQT